MLSSEKPVPREPMCTVTEREREKHGMEALHSAQVVLFAPTIDSYTFTKGGKNVLNQTQRRVDVILNS